MKSLSWKKSFARHYLLTLSIWRFAIVLTKNFISSKLEKILIRSLITSILVSMGILGGVVPEFSRQFSTLTFSYYSHAQDFTSDEVVRYSQAIFEVEMLRQQIYKEIKERFKRNSSKYCLLSTGNFE